MDIIKLESLWKILEILLLKKNKTHLLKSLCRESSAAVKTVREYRKEKNKMFS